MASLVNTAFWMFFFMVGFVATIDLLNDFGAEVVEKKLHHSINSAVLVAIYIVFIIAVLRFLRIFGTTDQMVGNALRNGVLLYGATRIDRHRVHMGMLVAVFISYYPYWSFNPLITTAFVVMLVALQIVNNNYGWITASHAHFALINVGMNVGMWLFTKYAYNDSWTNTIFMTIVSIVVVGLADLYSHLLQYRREQKAKLQYGNNHDELTGVRSLSLFRRDYANFQKMLANNPGDQMHLVMVDIDHFKDINDTYGHQIGDEALINFVRDMEAYLIPMPNYSAIYRTGGEEFSIILYGMNDIEARTSMEVYARQLENLQVLRENPALRLTISMGIAPVKSSHEKLSDFIARTDKNLYSAKRSGRSRIVQSY